MTLVLLNTLFYFLLPSTDQASFHTAASTTTITPPLNTTPCYLTYLNRVCIFLHNLTLSFCHQDHFHYTALCLHCTHDHLHYTVSPSSLHSNTFTTQPHHTPSPTHILTIRTTDSTVQHSPSTSTTQPTTFTTQPHTVHAIKTLGSFAIFTI